MRSPLRSVVSVVLTVVALAFGLVLVGPAPAAQACSCVATTDAEAAVRADVVFVGTLVGIAPPPPAEIMSSTDPTTYSFTVTAVYKGEVAERQEIVSASSSASCGLALQGAGPFLMFGATSSFLPESAPGPGRFYADLCNGSRPLTDGEDLAVLGAAGAPTPAEPVTGSAPPAADDPADRTLVAVAAFGLVGAAGLAAVVVIARRRVAA